MELKNLFSVDKSGQSNMPLIKDTASKKKLVVIITNDEKLINTLKLHIRETKTEHLRVFSLDDNGVFDAINVLPLKPKPVAVAGVTTAVILALALAGFGLMQTDAVKCRSYVKEKLVDYAYDDNYDGVRCAIKFGADTNMKDANDNTALIGATLYGHIDVVKLLVDNSANVRATTNSEKTALMSAISGRGHVDIVQYLIDHGAEIDHRDIYGETALSLASQSGYEAVAKFLVDKGANVNKG